jgi:hypothetical protein
VKFVMRIDYGGSGMMLMTYELDGGVFGNVGRVWRPDLGAERKRMMEEGGKGV